MGFDEDLAVDSLMQNAEIKIASGTRLETDSTLAGLPAKRVVMSGQLRGQPAFAKMWMAKRAHTTFLMLVMGKENSALHQRSESLTRCLKLIE